MTLLGHFWVLPTLSKVISFSLSFSILCSLSLLPLFQSHPPCLSPSFDPLSYPTCLYECFFLFWPLIPEVGGGLPAGLRGAAVSQTHGLEGNSRPADMEQVERYKYSSSMSLIIRPARCGQTGGEWWWGRWSWGWWWRCLKLLFGFILSPPL